MNENRFERQVESRQAPYIQGGFLNPVENAQSVFTMVMNAMSRPGTIVDFDAALAPPMPLNPVSAAVLLALCDSDTPVWLDPQHPEYCAVDAWLSFHTGARLTGEKPDAAFAVVTDTRLPILLGEYAVGSQEYPDRSTMLIIQVPGFEEEPQWTLQGPGIKGSRAFMPKGLGDDFIHEWSRNHALFPRGVDMVFAAQARLAALPRTAQLTLKREA